MRVEELTREAYERDGFAFPIDVMTGDEAHDLRRRIEALESGMNGLPRPMAQYLRMNTHIVMPLVHDMITHPQVVAAARTVLGSDMLCWGAELFIKEPHTDKVVSWHQDLTYWGIGHSDSEVTAWIALSPATPASGCMRFVAGSHKNAIIPHRDTYADNNLLSRGQELSVEVDEEDAVDVVLQPGQMSLHHGRMFHASGPNASGDRRIGLVFRYITPDLVQQNADTDFAVPVCGEDRFRNFDYIPRPEGDFAPPALERYDRIMEIHAKAQSVGAAQESRVYS